MAVSTEDDKRLGGAKRKELEIEPRLEEFRRRLAAGEELFREGERFEIGGAADISGIDIVYRPGNWTGNGGAESAAVMEGVD